MNWNKIRKFVNRRVFCTAAVIERDRLRLFPIGSLRVARDGTATYFELFARSVEEGERIAFLAVDAGLWFWATSLLRGRFSRPPALRLYGTIGKKRPSEPREVAFWHRRVGALVKTRGGHALWSRPGPIREVRFERVEAVNLGTTTKHLKRWIED